MGNKLKISFHPKAEDEILALPKKLQARVMKTLEMMDSLDTAALGMPYTKSLGNDFFELRAQADTNIARSVFFYKKGNHIVFVSAFVKKTQKISQAALKKAQQRKKECEDGTVKLK